LSEVESRGLPLNSKSFGIMQGPGEVGAYTYEARLWGRVRETPTREYMDFHNAQIGRYEELMPSYRSYVTKPYNARWRGINW
jgi:hypothetical protein